VVGRALRLIASSFVGFVLLVLAPVAAARTAASLTLNVTFLVDGTISVTLPDGTPVGVTSGAPTVIPGGYYRVLLAGPGGCAALPLFELKGPGEDVFADMTGGELNYDSRDVYFAPNSTYTWRNFGTPGVVHTFATSASVQGTPPISGGATASKAGSTVSSQDVVGSSLLPVRGTLTGAVAASGRLSLARGGKSVTRLSPGRYKIIITDTSTSKGFVLQKAGRRAVSLTGGTFVGRRTVSVNLTTGKWLFAPSAGKTAYSIVVR
jgi:hypothetical protein